MLCNLLESKMQFKQEENLTVAEHAFSRPSNVVTQSNIKLVIKLLLIDR